MWRNGVRRRQWSAPGRYRRNVVVGAVVALVVPIVATVSVQAASGDGLEILVLSNRADLVSGGDALVEVKMPEDADPKAVRVALDGRDITHEFAVRPNGHYQGLVTGLRKGDNELTTSVSRSSGAKLTVTNYSKQGPIFAGKQVEPWICETEKYGLGPASGPACVAPTRYELFYKSTSPLKADFQPYDPANPPSDVAKTTTDGGETVPYIVRRERGVIDRGIYDIAVLYDPGSEWSTWSPQSAWNRKVYWVFRGSASPTHLQGGTLGPANVLDAPFASDLPLSKGFAVASSSLNVGANNINDLVSTEALMMIKEHIVETYGAVRYTLSEGGSGGPALERLAAANYPGLLDGMITTVSIPDLWSMYGEFDDCLLLDRYFNRTSSTLWADPIDRREVHGMGGAGCEAWSVSPVRDVVESIFDPGVGCASSPIPPKPLRAEPEWVYDSQTNPTGVRCTAQDYQAPAFGYRAEDGFANRPRDNVGVQYGLLPLLREQISPEQFVDLNTNIGGRDIDFNWSADRAKADTGGLRNAYRSGRIPDYRQLAKVPMLDFRDAVDAEIHQGIHTKMVRARLIAANGHADNLVSWEEVGDVAGGLPGAEGDASQSEAARRAAFLTLDEWLTSMEADKSGSPLAEKVVRNKPAEARDTCWVAGRPDACGDGLPHYADPRIVAGGPVSNDVLKCQLKSIDWSDYGLVEFTDEYKRQLREAFPDGVCDWTKSGVEQQAVNGPWQSFTSTIGGQPLGPEPRSVPLKGKP